jgi:hypothetical protein
MKTSIQLTCLSFAFFAVSISGQNIQLPNENGCLTTLSTQPVFQNDAAKKEYEAFEKYTADFVANFDRSTMSGNCYVIPVVFHVYGTTQGGMPVNPAIINDAMSKLNNDFHGLNADYGTVHTSFLSIRDIMPDVTFALAEIDPIGNPTNGIVNHPVTSGYANGSGYDAAIAADAWDNYKYMNIYIMNDLFGDSVYTNSGYSYYPSTFMSDNNTARIVYNGAYLGINCTWEPEFASTLTHEYGHWLNLIHTFDGGCVAPNDQVADTPPCDYLATPYPCHPNPTANSPLNCNSNLINAENYMDYSGSTGCYKMFTQGQVARMYAALLHPSRQPLWQLSNLVATGLDYLCTSGIVSYNSPDFALYPNPSNGIFNISSTKNLEGAAMFVTNMYGQQIASQQNSISPIKKEINVSGQTPGIYFVHILLEHSTYVYKLNLQ